MPLEKVRRQARKSPVPGVWVPVIEEITFADPTERNQEYTYTFDNTVDNKRRQTHVKNVAGTGGSAAVERIDRFDVKDDVQRGQQSQFSLVNNDPPPAQPGSYGTDPQHKKVHYVRYCQNNNPSSPLWVEMELIDELYVKDPVDRSQETIFKLNWPKPETPSWGQVTFATCDMSLPVANNGGNNGIDPPWRFDPFQNLVNLSAADQHSYWWTFMRNTTSIYMYVEGSTRKVVVCKFGYFGVPSVNNFYNLTPEECALVNYGYTPPPIPHVPTSGYYNYGLHFDILNYGPSNYTGDVMPGSGPVESVATNYAFFNEGIGHISQTFRDTVSLEEATFVGTLDFTVATATCHELPGINWSINPHEQTYSPINAGEALFSPDDYTMFYPF